MSDVMILYVEDTQKALEHFTALGLQFKEEKHGVYGKIHWACEVNGKVFEIYPWPMLDGRRDYPSNGVTAALRYMP